MYAVNSHFGLDSRSRPGQYRRRWYGFGLLGVLVLLLGALVACTNKNQTTAAFATLDRYAQAANLGSLGQIVDNEHYGRVSISADPPTRRIAVVTKRSADELRQAVEAKLMTAGFHRSGGTWEVGEGDSLVTVFLDIFQPGETLPEGSSVRVVPSGSAAVVVRFVTHA